MNYLSKQVDTGGTSTNAQSVGGSLLSNVSELSTQRKLGSLLIDCLETMREITGDPELPTHAALLLLHVATRSEPAGVLELGKIIGMSQASSSRIISAYGRGTRDKTGKGIIEAYEDPSNWAKKLVRLTPIGTLAVESLYHRMATKIDKMKGVNDVR